MLADPPGMYDDIAGFPPFRRSASPSLGLSEPTIRRALRSGDLVQVKRGVLVGRRRAQLVTTNQALHALAVEASLAGLRGGSPAVACLGSAAALHGLDRLGQPPQRVRLYRERGGTWRDEEVAVLVCSLPTAHLGEAFGVPVTTLARTAVDLSRWVVFKSAVVVVDSALRSGCSRADLERVVRDCTRWPGVRNARRAVLFGDERAATPLESISRVVMAEYGLPEPDLQVPLGLDSFGRPTGIVDFLWEHYRVIGEADGLMKYDDPLALRAEKLRQEALEALGYTVVRWTWDDIWRRPDWIIARLRTAFRADTRRATA